MFYLEVVINKVVINYPELSPVFRLHFAELSTSISLPPLSEGVNRLGVGKTLTLEAAEQQLADWFQTYAMCIQLSGALVAEPPPYAVLSLQKLGLTDEIKNQQIPLNNLTNPKIKASLNLSLTFKYVQALKRTNLNSDQSTRRNNQRLKSGAVPKKTQNQNPKQVFSYIYGQPPSKPPVKATKKSTKPTSANPKKTQKPISKQQGFMAEDKHYSKSSFAQQQPSEAGDLFADKYYCPPTIQIVKNVQQARNPEILQKERNTIAPVAGGMPNYSFQNLDDHRKMQQTRKQEASKQKVAEAFSKKRLKQLVEDEFKSDERTIVVPVLENGVVVLKKLSQANQSEFTKHLYNKETRQPQAAVPAPQPQPIKPKEVRPSNASSTNNVLNILNQSISQYPQDFQSASQSALSIRKKGVEEHSISQIYSEHFESYSQSRSQIKKNDEISEYIQSVSHSQSRR